MAAREVLTAIKAKLLITDAFTFSGRETTTIENALLDIQSIIKDRIELEREIRALYGKMLKQPSLIDFSHTE